jgi:radical SAM superfamily enzyme YgiQ (UPF0313 family)
MYGNHPHRHAAAQVRQQQPDVVAISIRNLDDCTVVPTCRAPGFLINTRLDVLRKLVEAMREARPGAVFVLGGSGFSFCPELLLEELGVDYGFIGPGEKGLQKLIGLVRRHKSLMEIPDGSLGRVPNIIFRRNGLVHRGQCTYKVENEGDPSPICRLPGFKAIERFTKSYTPIRTKTGCSLRCSYCTVPASESLSLRPVRNVIRDIEDLVATNVGITRVFFADGEFNLPALDFPTEILEGMIASRLHEHLQWVAYLTVKPFTGSFIRLLRKSNCARISLTIDSFSDAILATAGKDFQKDEALALLDKLVGENIPTTVNLIIGLPGETQDTIRETITYVRAFAKRGIRFSISAGARVYPNTPLAEYVRNRSHVHVYGNITKQPLDPVLYCEPSPPSVIAKTVLRHVGHLPTTNVMNLNSPHRETRMWARERNAIMRAYYFFGENNYSEARRWLRKVTKDDNPLRVDGLWAMALAAHYLGKRTSYRQYLSRILRCEDLWPDRIDYDAVRELLCS